MTQRVACYARYSSEMQNQSSIEQQLMLCNEKAMSEGWDIYNCYTDAAISGSSMMLRHGIQNLLQDALAGKFDIVVAEALDRLARDLNDISGFYKQLKFAGVRIVTLSEGEIDTMHIGLKGTMNELFLIDLANKTRRGLRGKVENGKSGGGIGYGYRVVKQFDAQGEAIKGDREINQEQAQIVCRIFQEYGLENKSPKAIAAQLNQEGILSPSGKQWSQSSINGNTHRGTGILNNTLYCGTLTWNRQSFRKDPNTGRRVSRLNPESDWISKDVPELRIVPQELWDAAKARQKALSKKRGHLGERKRPQYLLSGLLTCGACGGGFSKINSERYGCSAARNKGESACNNKTTIKREVLEGTVLKALQTHLMRDDLVEAFCKEYTRHINALRSAQNAELKRLRSEQAKLVKDKENIIQAIKDGVPAAMVKDELQRVSERQDELKELIAAAGQEPRPFVHPAMASRYQAEVKQMIYALQDSQAGQMREDVRNLIEKIVLTPKTGEKELSIDLYGDLAGILKIASEDKSMKDIRNEKRPVDGVANDNTIYRPSVQLVAGAGCQRYLPLFVAHDIASKPPTTATLLSPLINNVEGVRSVKAADYTRNTAPGSMGGRKNG